MRWQCPLSLDQEGRIYQVVLGANGVVALASEGLGISLASFALMAAVALLFRPRKGR